jgi:hypothetical protein
MPLWHHCRGPSPVYEPSPSATRAPAEIGGSVPVIFGLIFARLQEVCSGDSHSRRCNTRLKPTEAGNRPHMHNRCIQSGPAFREHRHRVGGASHHHQPRSLQQRNLVPSNSLHLASSAGHRDRRAGLAFSHLCSSIPRHPAFSWRIVVPNAADQRHLILAINYSS